MKYLNYIAFIIIFLLPTHNVIAVTMSEDTNTKNATYSEESKERTVRGKLFVRHTDGKIETSLGTFNIKSAEVKDHRPIDDWYKNPVNAQVSLYFEDNRLTRVVIY